MNRLAESLVGKITQTNLRHNRTGLHCRLERFVRFREFTELDRMERGGNPARDAEIIMGAGNHIRNVAGVGRAPALRPVRLFELYAVFAPAADEFVIQRFVEDHSLVCRNPVHRSSASGFRGGAGGNGFEPLLHKPDLRFISGADIEKRLCVIRNDVRRVSAFRENAVDALTLRNRLFPLKNAVIESDSGTFMSNLWTPSGGWRNAEHLVKLALYGRTSFDASSWGAVSIYGALGANFYHNFNHVPGADEFQPQLMFGIMWEI